MAERDIVASILRYLKTVPECFAWKTHGSMYSMAGIPDIIACVGGRFVAFEVKTERGQLSKIQEITIQRIKDAKGNAYKVTSCNEVREIIQNLREGLPYE